MISGGNKDTMARQSEIKYQRLMEKAETFFIKFGYKAVSMDKIAAAAGISKMTIYKHFPSKEELFIKVLQGIMERTFDYVKEEVEKIEGTMEKINFLFHYNLQSTKEYTLAFYKDIMENQYFLELAMKEKKRFARSIFEGIIKDGIERGEIRQVDVSFMADMLMALIDGISRDFFRHIHHDEALQDFIKKLYDFLKYGLFGGKEVQ